MPEKKKGKAKQQPDAEQEKGKACTKGKAKGQGKGKACTKRKAKGQGKGKADSSPAKKTKKRMQEPEEAEAACTPAKQARASEVEGVSPVPVGRGQSRFLNSTKRKAQQKRLDVAQRALQQLRQASLPELRLPDAGFMRQSFTVCNGSLQGCSIGVILGTNSFYVYHAWVPPDLCSFVHTDRKGGVSVGWQSFHGVRLAWLGCPCLVCNFAWCSP